MMTDEIKNEIKKAILHTNKDRLIEIFRQVSFEEFFEFLICLTDHCSSEEKREYIYNATTIIVQCYELQDQVLGETIALLLLLILKFDVNRTIWSERTILHQACEQGMTNFVALLLFLGADINKRASFDETPLYLACKHKKIEVTSLLMLCVKPKKKEMKDLSREEENKIRKIKILSDEMRLSKLARTIQTAGPLFSKTALRIFESISQSELAPGIDSFQVKLSLLKDCLRNPKVRIQRAAAAHSIPQPSPLAPEPVSSLPLPQQPGNLSSVAAHLACLGYFPEFRPITIISPQGNLKVLLPPSSFNF